LFLVSFSHAEEKNYHWETAKIVAQSPKVLTVETDQFVYQWQEKGRGRFVLPLNEPFRFYHEGKYFFVVDGKDKKHKFALVGEKKKGF
jgi:hypothetical protein